MAALDPSIIWAVPFFPDDTPAAPALWPGEAHAWSRDLVEFYLDQLSAPGDLVVDPFAGQAMLPLAAQTGRRRLVLNHASPAALLGVLATASPPSPAVLDHAFSRIADAPRRGRTLAHHLAALYETICPECAQTIVAEQFTWDRAAGEPVEKRYHCPHCGSARRAPTDMADAAQVANLEVRGAAYWGLLSRLVKPGDPLTGDARALQDLYPARALLVISELLTAAEQRLSDSEELRAARAMILHVLSRGVPAPDPARAEPSASAHRPTPLQLPRRFVEHNLWLAFEQAHRLLRGRTPHPLAQAPDLRRLHAADGEGRVLALSLTAAGLAGHLGPGSVRLLLTDPPAFDPASYSLNFLWTGWLFGREAANRQRTTLSIEQWTWDWYARAMAAALQALRPLASADGRLALAFEDASARRALALLTAASAAGWRLAAQVVETALLPPLTTRWRWEFRLGDPALAPTDEGALVSLEERLQRSAQEATEALVAERGEPAPPALVQSACAVRWAELGLLAEVMAQRDLSRRPMSALLEQMRMALTPDLPPPGLAYTPAAGPEHPTLWAADPPPAGEPLADRVEMFVAQQVEAGETSARALRAAVYAQFPGWQTPDAALLAECVASYTEVVDDTLRLRAEDHPAARAADLAELAAALHDLGVRLGFEVWTATELGVPAQAAGSRVDPLPDWQPANLVWHQAGEAAFAFAFDTRASLGPWLPSPSPALAACARYVVLPGGRAGLLDFKLRRCPPWRTQLAWSGWEFVKFRHLRELARSPSLTLPALRARIGLDPVVTLPGQQLALFDMENPGENDHA